jgi:predicted transcriptional regulator
MGRLAENVYTDPAQIRHLKALVEELPANGHVVLLLNDGRSYDGVVCARPNVQMFRDEDDNEGINGVVRLERPDVPYWNCYVWLGDIRRVEHLDCSLGSEN